MDKALQEVVSACVLVQKQIIFVCCVVEQVERRENFVQRKVYKKLELKNKSQNASAVVEESLKVGGER